MNQRRPAYLRPSSLALTFVGGTLGAAAREGISLAFPAQDGIDWAVFAINISGAFLLGVLLDALARRGPDQGRRRALRLLVGTGFMGGFTTFSSFAVGLVALLEAGSVSAALFYGLGTVLLGAAATLAGISIATWAHSKTGEGAE